MPEVTRKPLAWFKTNPQVRKSFDEAELRPLGESLKVKQLQSLLCQPDGTIIAGERRYRAAKLVGMESLEVKIADEVLDETKIKLFQMQENKLREDLTLIDEMDGVTEIALMNPTWTGKNLAENLHMDAGYVCKLLAIARCPVARPALADGRLDGVSPAYEIAKAPLANRAGLLALRLSGATRDELARKARKPRVQGEKAIRIAISLPGGFSVVLAGKEMDIDQAIENLSECLKAAKKARDEGLSAKSFAAGMRDRANKN